MTESINSKAEQVLVCWIGNTDLLALGKYGHDHALTCWTDYTRRILKLDHQDDSEIETLDLNIRDSSIVLALNASVQNPQIPKFAKVILFTNRPSKNHELFNWLASAYPSFLKQRCRTFTGDISVEFAGKNYIGVDPWNYQEVSIITSRILKKFIDDGLCADNMWFNITPGTITQSTTLILVAKELSPHPNFIQVSKIAKRVDHCEIPFDINSIINNQAVAIERSAPLPNENIIGRTRSFENALRKSRRVAQYPITILLTGESGTGKEIFAREIHRLSGRSGNFIPINCATLNKSTAIGHFTGYWRGAYTDAKVTTEGIFHKAKDGTLFLDEIGECPQEVQAMLLRFLQPSDPQKPSQREWELYGPQPPNLHQNEKKYAGIQTGDIRIIAATNRNLNDLSLFRQDLYYRIEAVRIRLPSLEDRKSEKDKENGIDDLKDLANYYLKVHNHTLHTSKQFSSKTYEILENHIWTGNVRELQNVILRAVLFSPTDIITAKDIEDNLNDETNSDKSVSNITTPLTASSDFLDTTLASALESAAKCDYETNNRNRMDTIIRQYYSALVETCGNQKKAYTFLGLNPKTFSKRLNVNSPNQSQCSPSQINPK